MEVRTFTIPGTPVGKGRPKFSRAGAGVRTYTPEKTASYETLVKWSYTAASANRKPFEGEVRLTIVAYHPVPKSWSKKKREAALKGELRPMVKPDADNIGKAIADALNGLAYRDDAQVADLVVQKFYADEPRVEVEVVG